MHAILHLLSSLGPESQAFPPKLMKIFINISFQMCRCTNAYLTVPHDSIFKVFLSATSVGAQISVSVDTERNMPIVATWLSPALILMGVNFLSLINDQSCFHLCRKHPLHIWVGDAF